MSAYYEYRKQVDECLRNDMLTISMPNETRDKVLKKLRCPVERMTLYQYRRCNEFSFDDFMNNQITLVHPKHFNDCFEVRPYLNIEEFVAIYKLFDLKTAKKFIAIAKDREFTVDELQELGGKNPAYLIKDLSRKLTTPEMENVFFANWDLIQEEGLKTLMSHLLWLCNSTRDEMRIACFSENYDSPSMWGHYADSGRGFCVQHNLPSLLNMSLCSEHNDAECMRINICDKNLCIKDGGHWLLPVIYSFERPDFTKDLMERFIQTQYALMKLETDWSNYNLLAPLKFSCYKSLDWCYEREWRWIRTFCTDAIQEFAPISVGAISGLYLGENISQGHESILKSYALKHKMPDGTNIPVYKMKSNLFTKDYRLTAERVL